MNKAVTIITNAWFRLFLASVLAYSALYLYSQKKISSENYALGEETTPRNDKWDGQLFTAPTVSSIAMVMAEHRKVKKKIAGGREYILWLGNSQLHGINQYRIGDHIAPYWLKASLKNHGDVWPLGFSLPNANVQEHKFLSQYVVSEFPLRLLILELVFDDLREDGLRSGLTQLMTAPTTEPAPEPIAEETQRPQTPMLQNFSQKKLETYTESVLERAWPLWAERPALRARLLADLYELRNFVFNIKPTSVRKMLKPRYEKNMAALKDILTDFRQRGIPVLLYIAPIRQDIALPYDTRDYQSWKNAVHDLAREHAATLVNLEAAVPAQYWGSVKDGEVDFMHFQGEGHRLVSNALLPHVGRVVVARGRGADSAL